MIVNRFIKQYDWLNSLPAVQTIGTWLTEKRAKIGQISFFVALLIVTTSGVVDAQNVCNNPVAQGGFTLEKVKVCLGTPVRITSVPSSVSNVGYNFEYNGNGFPSNTVITPTYTYTKPGSYTIIQVGSGGGLSTGTIACQQVDVLPVGLVKFTYKACAGRRITIVPQLDDTNNKYDSYQIKWGDGVVESFTSAQFQAQPSHVYTNTQNRTIGISGVYNAPASCSSQDNVLSVSPQNTSTATAPVITTLKTIDDNNITLTYQGTSNVNIQLLQRDGSGVYQPTSQTGTSAGAFTVQTNARQTQCFQLASQDACGTVGATSDQVCSIVLTVTPTSKQNNLKWDAYQGNTLFRNYRLYRGVAPTGGLITNKATTTYSDVNNIQCGVQYCYSIEVTAGPTIVTSAPTCVTGVNTDLPDSFTTVLVSVENDKPRLIAALPPSASTSYTMVVSRSSGGGSFESVGAVSANTFIDNSADPNAGSYCYQVAYQNTCGQLSVPSKPVCTVWLSSQSPGGVDWTGDSPFTPGSVGGYTIEIINPDNGSRREVKVAAGTRYEPDPSDPTASVQQYRVVATSAQGSVSYSNFYTLRQAALILVPDAFTPNGDQANDVFLVKGRTSDQFKLYVYSRWGEVVFSSDDMRKGWDGTIGGQPALEGQYMYRIETQDTDGNKTVRTGAVLLLR